jgi:hypothetical protein
MSHRFWDLEALSPDMTQSRAAVDEFMDEMAERVARFIAGSGLGAGGVAGRAADSGSERFEELALAAFAYQLERIAPYRRMCERRGATPGVVADWRRIPMIPTAAFKSTTLAAAPPVEVFRSSGTTGGVGGPGEVGVERSIHHHPFPDLYRQTIDAAFPAFCLPWLAPGGRLPILSLIPTRSQLPDSSLSFMAEHVVSRWGSPESRTAIGPRGVEAAAARSWAGARQRAGAPVLILATAFALAQWLDALDDRLGLRFRLPAGSVVFETGGFKGRTKELSRSELLTRVQTFLGVPAGFVVREYGMTELTSQGYTRVLLDGDTDLFVTPPWMRVRIVDPETLEEAQAGRPGLIAVLDLANLGSALHLLTEDLGVAEGDGFRLLGRAAGAELRGCSLAAEELASRV